MWHDCGTDVKPVTATFVKCMQTPGYSSTYNNTSTHHTYANSVVPTTAGSIPLQTPADIQQLMSRHSPTHPAAGAAWYKAALLRALSAAAAVYKVGKALTMQPCCIHHTKPVATNAYCLLISALIHIFAALTAFVCWLQLLVGCCLAVLHRIMYGMVNQPALTEDRVFRGMVQLNGTPRLRSLSQMRVAMSAAQHN